MLGRNVSNLFILLSTIKQRKWAHNTEIRQERWHMKRLKNLKRFLRVFECCSFVNILEYRKIGKILQNFTLFLKNVVSASCLLEFEICYG